MSNIPLHCNICPKKPKFSDVSHLLTHIASKGHLSHYYKVKVRSSTEEDCRIMIEAYDQWYSRYRVEDLMSERMNLKDKRRSRAVRTQASSLPRNVSLPKPRPPRRDTPTSHEGMFDPRLGDIRSRGGSAGGAPRAAGGRDSRVTASPLPQVHSNASSIHHIIHPSALRHHPSSALHPHYHPSYHPHHHFNPSTPHGTVPYSQQYPPCMVPPGTIVHDFDIPYKKRRSEVYDDRESEETFSSRSFSVQDSISLDQYEEGCEEPSESTRLKGVFWPGMDIFDSATPEMKRKRNQKKDTSVVEQLEANSLDVEPMEMIFTPTGTLKKARKISGNPEDDETSPIRGDDSPIRQYSTFSRPPLMPVPFDPSRIIPSSNSNSTSQSDVTRHLLRSLTDERNDVDYAYGAPRRKRNFEIFQDREISFTNSAGFGLLNSEFHLPGHPEGNSSQAELPRYEYKDHSNHHHLYDPFHSHPHPNEAACDKENAAGPVPLPNKPQHMDNHHFLSHAPPPHTDTYGPSNSFSYSTTDPPVNVHEHYTAGYPHQTSSTVFLPPYKGTDDHDDRSTHRSHVSEAIGTEAFYR